MPALPLQVPLGRAPLRVPLGGALRMHQACPWGGALPLQVPLGVGHCPLRVPQSTCLDHYPLAVTCRHYLTCTTRQPTTTAGASDLQRPLPLTWQQSSPAWQSHAATT